MVNKCKQMITDEHGCGFMVNKCKQPQYVVGIQSLEKLHQKAWSTARCCFQRRSSSPQLNVNISFKICFFGESIPHFQTAMLMGC